MSNRYRPWFRAILEKDPIAGLLDAQFFRFLVVGTIGFSIDAILLLVLDAIGGGPYFSRAVSFPTATFATWILNRSWTFSGHKSNDRKKELARYLTVGCLAAVANLASYTIALENVSILRDYLIIPLGIGSIAGIFVNYTGMRIFVFKSHRPVMTSRAELKTVKAQPKELASHD